MQKGLLIFVWAAVWCWDAAEAVLEWWQVVLWRHEFKRLML